jgi:uncharacterized protein (TIGR02600 family)
MSRVAVRRNNTTTSGMVLIMVVAVIAVATLLLVALFAGTRHQLIGAQNDAALAREKMLADSAVALVIGQIAQASTQTNQAWISQPGLLRTYSTNAVRAPSACYKLYSTTNLAGMLDTSGNLNFIVTDVPATWSSTPNQYTDLNSPVVTVTGVTVYPILDPGATNRVTGVSIDAGHAGEMPVAWLYELQDGTLGPASGGTAANPIVARMAFWTDDDTCKVNINTAGCGSPWNTPRVNSSDDVAWSSNQPAIGEYSAYPGHPATTSLDPVLGANAYSPQQLLAFTPRYAWGGSQFDTLPTTNGETVPTKMDRLYASFDEMRYSTNVSGAGLRQTNEISAGQLETARFVLTSHSVAPETTLLGEPRIGIWPVADTNSASGPEITVTDEAITNAATVGAGTTNVRSYFFLRHNAQSMTDDLNTNVVPSNAQLFNDLVNRGNETLPGYGTTLVAKYPGAEWTQLMLEIFDYIRCINAIDSTPAPFVSYAAGNPTNGAGRGLVDPLKTTYGSGTNTLTLRGLGRCPTLSSLTLVFYVCGFGFKNGTSIDYEQTPDTASGTSWKANFLPASTNWTNVNSERIRVFAVPCTFLPACGYPEVSDACTIQIKGLNGLTMTNSTNSINCGFASAPTSRLLSDALSVLPADRSWGGNEGPLAWRAAALDAQSANPFTYVFSGTNSLPIMLSSSPTNKPTTGMIPWPPAKSTALSISSVNLTVLIQDALGNTLQTLLISVPSGSAFAAPTPVAEYAQDGSGNMVYPSYYMTVKNRVLATGTNRLFMVQPGDTTRSFEAGTDLRVIAGLSSVPTNMFPMPSQFKNANISNAHNLHFADGTAVCGASGANALAYSVTYPSATTTLTWTNWCNNTTTNYAWPISPPCSCPTGPLTYVTMNPVLSALGDWDTGPGFSPDGSQINLPDAGTTNSPANAYFSLTGGCVGGPTRRTPNALVPSPVIFGSLPAGINPASPTNSAPWRTLLFCPYPAADTTHPGFGNPAAAPPLAPDHLVLDNFWMPVVEPYPISTCMATAGKINLNDQIVPFTYLHRNTALHALLTDLRIPAINVSAARTYKSTGTPMPSIWNPVDESATIAQIENKFANNSVDAYLSESEICTVPLVPLGLAADNVADTQAALDSFWNGPSYAGGLTGDNLRELPYALLYGRLTTRSNSYTVHIRVQVLKKLTSDPQQNVWKEGTDVIVADWRGSYEIERYLDPAAVAPAAGSPLGPYKFRILSARQFAP